MTQKEKAISMKTQFTTKIRRFPVICEECGTIIPQGDTVILAGGGERARKIPRTVVCLDCYD